MGAINVGPTGNIQGTHTLMNLQTGKKITRNFWTEVPMPKAVNDHVLQLGEQQKAVHGLQFHIKNRILEEEIDPNKVNIAGVHDHEDEESDKNDSVQN